jgi:ABC-type nitrate/sulfonate/bicarbonate transport system permease component
LITTSTYYLNTDLVFAGAITLGVMGIAFYGTVVLIQHVVVFWRS